MMTSASSRIVDRFIPLAAQLPQNQLAVEHVHLAAEGFEKQLFSHRRSVSEKGPQRLADDYASS